MKGNKSRYALPLMLVSLALLIVLQTLWLRTEYHSLRENFSRETQVVFRSTLHQLSDSIFSRSYMGFAGVLTDDTLRNQQVRQWISSPENIRRVSIIELGRNDSIVADRDTIPQVLRQMSFTLQNPDNPGDSLRISRRFRSHPQDMRWMMSSDTYGYDKDSISVYYRRNLNPALARIPFDILEKEFSPQGRSYMQSVNDSLPFTTAWVPFARKLYAAEFSGADWHLRRKLMPQAGFALFTSLLILASFLLIYRNMRLQGKLMEQKDDFISNISHELKTPLASVGVTLEALRSFNVIDDKERTTDYLHQASLELKKLEIMTEKILRTTVMDFATEIREHKQSVDMHVLAEQALASLALLSQSKGMEVKLEKHGTPVLQGNHEHLQQLISNLADNAIKYAWEGRVLTVITTELPDSIILEIRDKGPGIPPEHKHKVFEKFYRIPSGNVHDVKGYGLGLHYAHEVVKHHNGKIMLYSHPGKGCRFVIKLPKA